MRFVEKISFSSNANIRSSVDDIKYWPYHVHDNILEIICVINGNFIVNGYAQEYELSKGSVFFINPDDPHRIVSSDENGVLMTMHIDSNYYAKLIGIEELPYFVSDSFLNSREYCVDIRHLRFLLTSAHNSYMIRDAVKTIESKTISLLEHMIEDYVSYAYIKMPNGELKLLRAYNYHHDDTYFKRIYHIINYMEENISTGLKSASIAEHFHLSQPYFLSYIKETSGLTYAELRTVLRCEAAEKLLVKTDKSLDEIATLVGFSSRNHLTTQFKQCFHKQPGAYRKSIIEDIKKNVPITTPIVDEVAIKNTLNNFLEYKVIETGMLKL